MYWVEKLLNVDQYAISDVCNPLGDEIHWGTIDHSLHMTMVIKMQGFYYLLLSRHSKKKSEIYKFRHIAPEVPVMLKWFPIMHTVLILSIFMWYIFCKYDKLTSWLLHAKLKIWISDVTEMLFNNKTTYVQLVHIWHTFLSPKGLGFGHIVLVYLSDGNISLGNIIWYMLEETS